MNNRKRKMKNAGLLPLIAVAVLCCFLTGCAAGDGSAGEAFDRFRQSSVGRAITRLIDGDTWEETDTEQTAETERKEPVRKDTSTYIKKEVSADTPVMISREASESIGAAVSENESGDAATPDTSTRESATEDEEEPSDDEIRMSTKGMYRYYYSTLDEKDRTVYRDIYKILTQYGSDVKMKSKNTDRLDRVFQLVMNDHPEIFYVKGYNMKKYTQGDKVVGIEFSGTYEKTRDEIAGYNEKVEEYTNRCLDGVPQVGSDYDKVKYVYDYLIDHTQYNLNARDNQNILSVCCYGQSVCQGYAKTTQYLLNRLGIPCILVTGTAGTGESHAWNIAYVDGIWCNIDTTWGDASYKTNSPEAEPGINYDYLCASDDIMKGSHLADRASKLPDCTSLDNYYYVKEGTYFTNLEEESRERLKQLFEDYYDRGADRLVVKCSNIHVYYDMLDYLIDKEHIFDLQKAKDGKVSYARLEDSYALLFYL